MCVIEKKTYVRAGGDQQSYEKNYYCGRNGPNRLCSRVEVRDSGAFRIEEVRPSPPPTDHGPSRTASYLVTDGPNGTTRTYNLLGRSNSERRLSKSDPKRASISLQRSSNESGPSSAIPPAPSPPPLGRRHAEPRPAPTLSKPLKSSLKQRNNVEAGPSRETIGQGQRPPPIQTNVAGKVSRPEASPDQPTPGSQRLSREVAPDGTAIYRHVISSSAPRTPDEAPSHDRLTYEDPPSPKGNKRRVTFGLQRSNSIATDTRPSGSEPRYSIARPSTPKTPDPMDLVRDNSTHLTSQLPARISSVAGSSAARPQTRQHFPLDNDRVEYAADPLTDSPWRPATSKLSNEPTRQEDRSAQRQHDLDTSHVLRRRLNLQNEIDQAKREREAALARRQAVLLRESWERSGFPEGEASYHHFPSQAPQSPTYPQAEEPAMISRSGNNSSRGPGTSSNPTIHYSTPRGGTLRERSQAVPAQEEARDTSRVATQSVRILTRRDREERFDNRPDLEDSDYYNDRDAVVTEFIAGTASEALRRRDDRKEWRKRERDLRREEFFK